MFVWTWLSIFVATLSGVEIFRRWSLRRRLLDVPNERSSHSVPTPRGGGAVIVATITGASAIYSLVTGDFGFLPYLAAGAIVAAVSFFDDVRPLSPFFRLLTHAAAAAVVVYVSGIATSGESAFGDGRIGPIAMAGAFLFVVWLTNAYNFMDGIDGIAALQAIVAGASWAVAGKLAGLPEVSFLGGAVAAAGAGFLVLNWQPAKIFMGDVGSAFLGFMFAVIPLYAAQRAPSSAGNFYLTGILVVWFFLFDTVVTMAARALRGARIWEPHREHIYQKLVIGGMRHATATSIYGALAAFVGTTTVMLLFRRPSDAVWVFAAAATATALLIAVLIAKGRK